MTKNNKNTKSSARDPHAAVQDLMGSISALSALYEQETAALTDADTNAFLALQDRKLEAARAYQVNIEELLRRKGELGVITQSKKEQLAKMQADFAKLAQRNKEALHRMERCLGRVGSLIRNAAKDAAGRQRTVNYGECGHLKTSENKTVSMGVNETA